MSGDGLWHRPEDRWVGEESEERPGAPARDTLSESTYFIAVWFPEATGAVVGTTKRKEQE